MPQNCLQVPLRVVALALIFLIEPIVRDCFRRTLVGWLRAHAEEIISMFLKTVVHVETDLSAESCLH